MHSHHRPPVYLHQQTPCDNACNHNGMLTLSNQRTGEGPHKPQCVQTSAAHMYSISCRAVRYPCVTDHVSNTMRATNGACMLPTVKRCFPGFLFRLIIGKTIAKSQMEWKVSDTKIRGKLKIKTKDNKIRTGLSAYLLY